MSRNIDFTINNHMNFNVQFKIKYIYLYDYTIKILHSDMNVEYISFQNLYVHPIHFWFSLTCRNNVDSTKYFVH